jgi:hypothetical protein
MADVGCAVSRKIRPDQVSVELEPFSNAYADICKIMHYHWLEVAKDLVTELDLDHRFFAAMDRAGKLVLVTARHGKTLVGYILFCIFRPPHYNIIVAADDAHYLLPRYRTLPLFTRMVRCGEAALKSKGVQVVRFHTKTKVDRTKVFKHLGYEPEEILVQRRI